MGGGKVVKNAAGFDLPKLMVGSLGRLGVIVELSLKVFPRPEATATVRFPAAARRAGARVRSPAMARGPIPVSALDLDPRRQRAPLGSPVATHRADRRRAPPGSRVSVELASHKEPSDDGADLDAAYWDEARRFAWVAAEARLVVVPVSPRRLLALDRRAQAGAGVNRRYGRSPPTSPGSPGRRPNPLADSPTSWPPRRSSGVALTGEPLAEPLLGARDRWRLRPPPARLDPAASSPGARDETRDPAREPRRPRAADDADPICACVHCGFCLPTCPTYVTMGEEMDSPRGRILLMKEVLEGKLEVELAQPYLDNCLGCQACETACPSGVKYGDLITEFRGQAEPDRKRPPVPRDCAASSPCARFPTAGAFRAAARTGALARKVRRGGADGSAADGRPAPREAARRPPVARPASPPRASAAPASPCSPAASSRSSTRRSAGPRAASSPATGSRSSSPPARGCCGSLAMHAGEAEGARRLARRNLDRLPRRRRRGDHHRRRLRLGDARVRRPLPRRARAGGRRPRSRAAPSTSPSSSPDLGLGEAPPGARRRRAGSPTTTPATSPTPRRVTAAPRALLGQVEDLDASAAGRGRALLRLGRHLQRRTSPRSPPSWASARRATCSPPERR